jgi:hypothetical protein
MKIFRFRTDGCIFSVLIHKYNISFVATSDMEMPKKLFGVGITFSSHYLIKCLSIFLEIFAVLIHLMVYIEI